MNRQVTDTIFLVRPSQFRLNEQTAVNNYFQPDPELDDEDHPQEKALKEFDKLVKALRQAGVNVIVFDDHGEETPDSIFPNNWISTHENGRIILYPMFAENRRKERKPEILEYFQSNFEVSSLVDFSKYEAENEFLESTGSLILDRQNRVAYAALSERTTMPMLKQFEKETSYTIVAFQANQTVEGERVPIYHTNVMMSLGAGFAVVCLDSIDIPEEKEILLMALENTGKDVIDISAEQVNHFAGNIIQLESIQGDKLIVMSDNARNSLRSDQLEDLSSHGKIIGSDIPVIEHLGGGGVRCMIAEVFLRKK